MNKNFLWRMLCCNCIRFQLEFIWWSGKSSYSLYLSKTCSLMSGFTITLSGLIDGSFASFIPSVADWKELLKAGDIFLKDKWKQGFRISIMKHDFLESRLGELFASVTWKVCLLSFPCHLMKSGILPRMLTPLFP